MPKCYAQLNDNNVCISVNQLSGEVDASNLVPINNFDEDKLWRKYENGQWSEEKFKPEKPVPQPSTKERIGNVEQQQLNLMAGLADLYELLMSK